MNTPESNWARLRRRALGHARFLYWTLLALVVGVGFGYVKGCFSGDPPPPVSDQVRKIELAEQKLRDGSLLSKQNVDLRGDGTRSWAFLFAEHASLFRMVIYDLEHSRLRDSIEITSRVRLPVVPANLKHSGLTEKRARNGWLQLNAPHVSFDTPVVTSMHNGTRLLLIPVSAFTGPKLGQPDTLRETVVAVFWQAGDGRYVMHQLDRGPGRWTFPSPPSDLQLELRAGYGFHAIPTATSIRIDALHHLVFAVVGQTFAQVHAFAFPYTPGDLEECPVYAVPQPPALIVPASKIRQTEDTLARGCPQP